jgi:hypothetical protein
MHGSSGSALGCLHFGAWGRDEAPMPPLKKGETGGGGAVEEERDGFQLQAAQMRVVGTRVMRIAIWLNALD